MVFDTATGRHIETVPRLTNQTTHFLYDGQARLDSIRMPVPTGAGARDYVFSYAAGSGTLLSSVSAPPIGITTRTTSISYSGGSGSIITRITDPDGGQIDFLEDSTFTNRVIQRMNRGVGGGTPTRVPTDFTFNRLHQVESSRLNPGLGQDSIIIQIDHGETESLDHFAPITSSLKTVIDGPRMDVPDRTTFALNGFGAPDTIIDAVGERTVLTRGKAGFPALVTNTVLPNGRESDAFYNNRGNADSVKVDGPSVSGLPRATTKVVYGETNFPDFPTLITQPTGERTIIDYDNANGNRISQADGRSGSTVTFNYYTSGAFTGLYKKTISPITSPDSVHYDALGNVDHVETPLGITTTMVRDEIGRVTLTETPVVTNYGTMAQGTRRDRLTYDLMDRVTVQTMAGGAVSYSQQGFGSVFTDAADSVTVENDYDPEGNLLFVDRDDPNHLAATDTRAFTFDNAGRTRTQTKGDGLETMTYDGAGNVLSMQNPLSGTITMRYDTLNRLTRRIVPGRSFGQQTCEVEFDTPGGCITAFVFPLFPNDGSTGLVIAADTARFTYDEVGNMLTAENRDAHVKRTYFINGQIQSDTIRIRELPSDGSSCANNPAHSSCFGNTFFDDIEFGITYSYDLSGRPTSLNYPAELVAAGDQLVSMTYDDGSTGSGSLETITDPRDNTFTYAFDLENRMSSLTYSNGVVETRTYDGDSRLETRQIRNNSTSTTFVRDSMEYDVQNKVIYDRSTVEGVVRQYHTRYASLGALIGSEETTNVSTQVLSQERFQVDGFGNTLEKQREEDDDGAFVPVWDYVYLAGVITDFFVQEGGGENGNYPDDFRQDTDNAGNVIETERRTSRTEDNPDVVENLLTRVLTKNWYGHDGKLRFSQTYNSSSDFAGNSSVHDGAFQQYWYDALGRRIQVRSRQDDSTICDQGTTCESYVERVVWAGDQMIGEFRGPGDDGASGRLNVLASNGGSSNPAGPVERFGKVAYTYGLGIDSPLSVVRGETVEVFPFTNGRGQYSIGADTAGAKISLNIEWPGRLRKAFLDRDKVPGQAPDKGLWVGNVVTGFADQSGLMYRRNRYYDPQTGQFTQEDPIGLGGGVNLYGYAGGDPVNLADPFGLMGDTILVQYHEILGSGRYHTLIRITPSDQANLDTNIYANIDEQGRRYATLGAGPSKTFGGKLVSNLNRPTDASPHEGGVIVYAGDDESVAARLISLDRNYGDNLDYDVFPKPDDRSYNSNSYVAGLLSAAGLPKLDLATSKAFPGLNKPVPGEYFRRPRR